MTNASTIKMPSKSGADITLIHHVPHSGALQTLKISGPRLFSLSPVKTPLMNLRTFGSRRFLREVTQLGDMPCSWFFECTRSSKTTHGAAECLLRTTPLQLHFRARPSKVRGSPEVDDRPFLCICSSRLGGPTTDCGTKPTSKAQVPNRAPS